jgi:hypothetical protein
VVKKMARYIRTVNTNQKSLACLQRNFGEKMNISFQLPETIDGILKELTDSGLFMSQSEVIRFAILTLYKEYYTIINGEAD